MNSNLLNTEDHELTPEGDIQIAHISPYYERVYTTLDGTTRIIFKTVEFTKFILADRKATKERVLKELAGKLPEAKDTWVNKDLATPEQIRMKCKEWGFNDALAATRKAIEEVRQK